MGAEYTDILNFTSELLSGEKSNSGVYMMGSYEVQILDSFGKPDDRLAVHGCCAVYERLNQ